MNAITGERTLSGKKPPEGEIPAYFQTAGAGKPPDEYALYMRAGNALFRAGVETMSQLCQMRENEIRKIRGIGANCFTIIIEGCEKYRYAAKRYGLEMETNDALG